MNQLSERPFFVVGHPRSGTTLLRFILSSHPRLHIPEETGFIPFLGLVPGRELSRRETEQIVGRIEALNHLWQGIGRDLDSLYQGLPAPTPRFLLDALYRQHIATLGAGEGGLRWGDKTPGYINYIPLLADLFPQAQFIHVIRDGRDAALSAWKKWPERRWYMTHYYLLNHWMHNVCAGRRAGRGLGGQRYIEVQYERLVGEPEAEIRRLCTFLQEPFVPAMLDHTGLARQVGPGVHNHTEVQQAINTASVARWRSEMAPFYQKVADRVAGTTLKACGYQLANAGSFSLVESGRWVLLAAHFRLMNGVRSLLYKTGRLTLNRDLRQEAR